MRQPPAPAPAPVSSPSADARESARGEEAPPGSLAALGPAIRTLRKRRGLTQSQLAEAVGASRQAVSRWEDGSVLPSLSHVCRLGQVLEVGLDELVCQGGGWAAPGRDDVLGVTAVGEDGRLALSKAAARHMGLEPGDKLVLVPCGPEGVTIRDLDSFLRVAGS